MAEFEMTFDEYVPECIQVKAVVKDYEENGTAYIEFLSCGGEIVKENFELDFTFCMMPDSLIILDHSDPEPPEILEIGPCPD